jgi:hypothetical protein
LSGKTQSGETTVRSSSRKVCLDDAFVFPAEGLLANALSPQAIARALDCRIMIPDS